MKTINTISDTLGYTIDTYTMFNPADAIADEDWTDDTEFDHPAYRADLARLCAGILEAECADNTIAKSFKVEGSYSPSEYNFKTDNAELEITLNERKLMAYIKAHLPEFSEYLKEHFTSYSGFMSFVANNWADFQRELDGEQIESDRNWAIMLGWYMHREVLTDDEYHEQMWEGYSELAYNHARNLAPLEDE